MNKYLPLSIICLFCVAISAIYTSTTGCSPSKMDQLIETLMDKTVHFHDRKDAAWALREYNTPKAIGALIYVLKDTLDDLDVRSSVAESLGAIKDTAAVIPLINTLGERGDNDFRYTRFHQRVILSLGEIGDERSIKPFVEILKSEEEPDNSDFFGMRQLSGTAGSALTRIGSASVIPLLSILKDESSKEVARIRAIKILGNLQDTTSVLPLIIELNDDSQKIREETINSLGKIMDQRAVRPLILSLNDSNFNIRAKSAIALGMIKNDIAIEPLISILSDKNSYVRASAAFALGELHNKRAIRPLISILKDKNQNVYRSSEEALGKLGKPAIEYLVSIIKEKEINVSQDQIARALGHATDMESTDLLIGLLNDENSDVRTIVIYSFYYNKDSSSVEPLILRLKDRDKEVRKAAARVLECFNNTKASEALRAALNEKNLEIISYSYAYFIRIGVEGTEELLISALDKHGNKDMAIGFLNSGNFKLIDKGREWLDKNNYEVYSTPVPSGSEGLKWGQNR